MKKMSLIVGTMLLVLAACAQTPSTQSPISNADQVATIVAGTLLASPSLTTQPTLTDIPVPTETIIPTNIPSEPLAQTDIQSVLNWVSYALLQNKPEMIAELIGDNGTEFGGRFASQVAIPRYNNSEVIVSELKKGLQTATTTCIGYNVTLDARPDKAYIYYSGLQYDWDTDITGFIFFYQDKGWELVSISPVPQDQTWSNLYQTLWACP